MRTNEPEKHPICAAWPEMTTAEKDALIADVKDHGVRVPVVYFEGKILDGWHRFKAAELAGRDCPAEDYVGTDPVGYVISSNAHRRHLNKEVVAEAVASTRKWKGAGRPLADGGDGESTLDAMSKEAGVSLATMRRAKKKIADPEGSEEEKKSAAVKRRESVVADKPKPKAERQKLELSAKDKTIQGLEEKVLSLSAELKLHKDSKSPELSKRKAVLTAQTAEIKTLKGQVATLTTKLNDCTKAGKAYHGQVKKLQDTIDGIESNKRGNKS